MPVTLTEQPALSDSLITISSPSMAPEIGFNAAPSRSKPTDKLAAEAGAKALNFLDSSNPRVSSSEDAEHQKEHLLQ